MSWSPARLAVAYDDRLLDWRLGEGHPTDPVRARLCVAQLDVPCDVEPITWRLTDELGEVHDPAYVAATLAGRNSEWHGVQPDLGAVAAHMFAATVQLVHAVDAGRVRVGFSPQGAKHHAMADRGSGFCVFNDMAWAARHFAAQGRRVLYVDLDAHHGDGVEALCAEVPGVVTFSVHDSTIFPGTGRSCDVARGVHNVPLLLGAGDGALLDAVGTAVDLAEEWRPDVLLVAIGADGHETDPLSSLRYTYDGYRRAGDALGRLAGEHDVPVLMGGAGGYQPRTHTPAVWATFVAALYGARQSGVQGLLGRQTPRQGRARSWTPAARRDRDAG